MRSREKQEANGDSQIPYPREGIEESDINNQDQELVEARNSLPEYYTLRELEEIEFNIHAIVEDYLYEANVSIISAKPKVGKSTLQRYLAKCLADGDDFLGRKTEKGKVLYLALEEPLANVQRDFKAMNVLNKDNIIIAPLIDEKDRFLAMESLIKTFMPSLVIVDTMIHITSIKDLNDYIQTTGSLKNIRNLAEIYRCHVSLVHHSRKGESMGNDSVLGSTGLSGGVDLIQNLEMDNEKIRLISSNGRSGQHFDETPLVFDEESMHFSIDRNYKKESASKALEEIQANPGISRKGLQDALQIRSQTLSEALNLLEDRGLIEVQKIDGKKAYFSKSQFNPEGMEV